MGAKGPERCQLCRCEIIKTHYFRKIRGENLKICPNCNSELSRRDSKAAVDRLIEEEHNQQVRIANAEAKRRLKQKQSRQNIGCLVVVLIIAGVAVFNSECWSSQPRRPSTSTQQPESSLTITVPAEDPTDEHATPATEPDGLTPGVRRVR